jgi:hypothetical protein
VLSLMAITAACSGDGLVPLETEFAESPYEHCLEDGGIQICIERTAYAPVDLLPFTVANGEDRAVFLDSCSGGVEGQDPVTGEWGPGRHGVSRLCDFHATRSDVLAHMRYLPRSQLVFDTFHVNSQAQEGNWRVWVLILDGRGLPVRERTFTSPTFEVIR